MVRDVYDYAPIAASAPQTQNLCSRRNITKRISYTKRLQLRSSSKSNKAPSKYLKLQ